MPRKKPEPVHAELLPPSRTLSEADFKRMVAEAIEAKVTEAMSHGSDLQPWFQSREITNEMKRGLTVSEQRKWSAYYLDWGCIACGSKEKGHHSNGFCHLCYCRVKQRLAASIRRRAPAPSAGDLSFMDTVRMAREALAPRVLPKTTTTALKQRRQRVSAAESGGLRRKEQ